MTKKTDLRIIKTNKVLFESLILLMKEKSFEKITISDICEKALINRSTFYAHYEDKVDLLEALIEEQKNNLLNRLKDNNFTYISKDYYMKTLSIIIDHVDDKRDIYSTIFSNNINGFFIDFLKDVISKDLLNKLKGSKHYTKTEIPIDVIAKFYLGGITNVTLDWILNKEKYNKKQLLSYLDKLIPNTL